MSTGYGGYPPAADGGIGGLVQRLGDRVWRRAEPRFGITLAGVGVLMIIFGVLVWATDYAVGDVGSGDDPDTTLGIVLSGLVIAAGYVLLVKFKRGPLATAGVAAAVLAVPVLLAYATFDPVEQNIASDEEITFDEEGDVVFEDEASFADQVEMPFNIHVIALGSIAAWMLSFLFVPAASGRLFFLGASLFFAWLWLLEIAEEGAIAWVLSLPFSTFFFPFYALASTYGGESQLPDLTAIGAISLLVGAAYYASAFAFDRTRRHGLATPFAVAGLVVTAVGIGHMGDDLKEIGVGILLIVVGTLLALYGSTQNRRFTTWVWTFGIGFGVLLIAGKAFEENVAGFGISAIVLGVGVIALGWFVSQQFQEPDELEPGPSRFTPRRPGPQGPVVAIATNQGYGTPSGGWAAPPAPPAPQPPQGPPSGSTPPYMPPNVPPQQPGSGQFPQQPPTAPPTEQGPGSGQFPQQPPS